jgi:hypothetical protein
MKWPTPTKYDIFRLMATLGHGIMFCKLEYGHNILYGCQLSSSQNFGFRFCIWSFLNQFYIESITLKVEGPNQDIFGDLPCE